MTPDRDELRNWLRAVMRFLGWNGSNLADKVGVKPSTINRFLNSPEATHTLSAKTLKAIERATGYAMLQYPAPPNATRIIAEPDALPFEPDLSSGDKEVDDVIAMLRSGHQAIDPWILKTDALIDAGYLPGDVLLVDLSLKAEAGDIVCAQVYDWARMNAQTVFRLYQPPYLLAANMRRETLRPHVVDDNEVIIKGVVTQSIRPRRSRVNAAA